LALAHDELDKYLDEATRKHLESIQRKEEEKKCVEESKANE
jgi:hypothetical protein